ncbi:MAG: hypothetical protein TREMPRED_000624 [Tremellales sp. Tagirdzhanova-0007]|nr:MAG: hypothetical protein TREMPRED_000624 [Tremellales sp. Tagirdzhanova-0007]
MTPELVTKVENRLCSSKSVAEGVKATVAWLVSEEGAKLISRTASRDHKQEGIRNNAAPDNLKASAVGLRGSLELAKQGCDDEATVFVNEDAARQMHSEDEKGIEASSGEEDRAAEEAGWESGSVLEFPSASSDEDESNIPEPKRTKSVPITNRTSRLVVVPATSKRPITSSTFLPTLSTGYTLGESDSDPDLDRDPSGIVGIHVAERKNRRGQRARQACVLVRKKLWEKNAHGSFRIWEKKFGKNAMHVIKAREEERNGSIGKGWSSSRGKPRSALATGHERRKEGGSASRDFPPRIAGPPPRQIPTAAASKSLHPSWEAARLRKAKEVAAAPKSTKIVFD